MSIRSFFMAKMYDASMRKSEEKHLGKLRAEILSQARGTVLELGAGTGINLKHYPEELQQLIATEPDRHMRNKLEARLSEYGKPFELLDCAAEAIPLADQSVDTVVSTLVLCSVKNPCDALREIRRVLKPGGRLIFLEHIHSENHRTQKWQRLLEPIWILFAGNCHLTRSTDREIFNAGFIEETLSKPILEGEPAVIREWVCGVARSEANP